MPLIDVFYPNGVGGSSNVSDRISIRLDQPYKERINLLIVAWIELDPCNLVEQAKEYDPYDHEHHEFPHMPDAKF